MVGRTGLADTAGVDAATELTLLAQGTERFTATRVGAAALRAQLTYRTLRALIDLAVAVVVHAVAGFLVLGRLDDVFAEDLALGIALGDANLARALLSHVGTRQAGAHASDAREAEQEVLVVQVVAVDSAIARRVQEVEVLKPQVEGIRQLVRLVRQRRIPRTGSATQGAVGAKAVLGVVVLRRVAGLVVEGSGPG